MKFKQVFLLLALLFFRHNSFAASMPSDMHDACKFGKANEIKSYVRQGLVNATGYGTNCLYLTAVGGYTEISLYLINSGANPEIISRALAPATTKKNYKLIEAMLQHGGNPWLNIWTDNDPIFPWMIITENDDVDALKIYLNNGWNPAERLSYGYNNPLDYAAKNSSLNVASELSKNKSLLNGNLNFNGNVFFSSKPLISAISSFNSQTALMLLDAGASANSFDFNEYFKMPIPFETALGIAARKGMIDVVQKLIEKGAAINMPVSNTYLYIKTPLCSAAAGSTYTNSIEAVKLLLQNNADANGCPIFAAILSKNMSVLEFLVVEGKADVNQKFNFYDYGTQTPLNFALVQGNIAAVEFLKQHGATQ